MYRIYEVRGEQRRLLGGTPTREAAEAFVLRLAGNPLITGAASGSYRGPDEFLPRAVTGGVGYAIVESPRSRRGRRSAAA